MTALEMLLARVDLVCETMEASMMTSGVAVLDVNNNEDRFENDGLEAAAAVR